MRLITCPHRLGSPPRGTIIGTYYFKPDLCAPYVLRYGSSSNLILVRRGNSQDDSYKHRGCSLSNPRLSYIATSTRYIHTPLVFHEELCVASLALHHLPSATRFVPFMIRTFYILCKADTSIFQLFSKERYLRRGRTENEKYLLPILAFRDGIFWPWKVLYVVKALPRARLYLKSIFESYLKLVSLARQMRSFFLKVWHSSYGLFGCLG